MPALVNNDSAKRWALVFAAALVSILFACIACTADSELGAKDPKDAYYNLMVRGWLQGTTSLSLEAPAGLQALPDPYDPKANAQYRGWRFYPPRVHDLSYFKGKLYAYFSPAPAVLAFLPFHLLTGRWLSHQEACLLFCLVEFLGAVALVWSVRDRFFTSVGYGSLATVIVALGFLSLCRLLLERPDVWEVPLACAQAGWMLVLLSVWWILNHPGAGWRLFLLAGTSAALAAGSRPSTGFCGMILLIPAYRIFRQGREEGATRRKLGSLAALVLPSVAVGAALLAFNWVRFGEWLEFGQKYQLNGDSVRHASSAYFNPAYLGYNLRLYAIQNGDWSLQFPFVRDIVFPPAPQGYGGGDHPFGMIPHVPAILFAMALAVSWRAVAPAQRGDYFTTTGMVAWAGLATAVPLLMFFSGCMRYEFEFAMYIAILAAVGYFGAEACASGWARALVRTAWGAALAASIAFCLLLTVSLRAQTLLVHGKIDMAKGNRSEAAEHFRGALSLQPNLVAARAMLGAVHVQENDFRLAAGDFARALEDEPDSAVLLSQYGYCLFKLGRDGEAVAALARAVEMEGDTSQTAALLKYARQRLAEKAKSGGK